MRTIYLECAMGAAGDMLMAALYELYPEKEQFLEKMNSLIPGVEVVAEPAIRQGISGTHMRVIIHGEEEGHHHHHDHGHDHHHGHHHHEHRGLGEIEAIIDGFDLPWEAKCGAKAAYGLIAEAESRAHGVPVGEVHFHEVGALDAVIDVTGACYLMHLLAPQTVLVSPVTVGSGTVRTAHGILPVPAPATAHLLEGAPITTGDIAAELCTPTGAALLRSFSDGFGAMPAGRMLASGYGCGTKDFPRANCLRAFLLETEEKTGVANDAVTELRANIDDMTGEALGYAMEKLLASGALDVSYVPIQMKKDRPGVLLMCLCRPNDADRLAKEILTHTSTFGVRRFDCQRYAMAVEKHTVDTAFGPVACKTGTGYGLSKSKPEYEDMAAAAREQGVSLDAIREAFYRAR